MEAKHPLSSTPRMTVPSRFDSPAQAAALIDDGEFALNQRLTHLSEQISQDCAAHGIHVIRLSGPTCAGKTIAAEKITAALERKGLSVYPVSLDDFFYDNGALRRMADTQKGGELDYDSVDALDLPTLAACVSDLLTYGRADIPIFDFLTGDRSKTRRLEVPEGVRPVFLFEGIQAVYPQVAQMFEGVPSRSVFVNACASLVMGEREYAPHRLRLMRRLVRDAAKRGSDPAFTLYLWRSVRTNEKASILPFADACDYMMDTSVGYDVHILAPHLRRLLTEHPVTGADAAIAQTILQSVADVEGIPSAYLPRNSFYREFVPVCID